MPIGEIYAVTGVFKTLFDSAKALKDMNDSVVRHGAVIELLEKIVTAREAQAALLEEIDDLKKEKAAFETWEAERKRYKLEKLPPGVHAFTLQPEMANGEPPHYICATCYHRGLKSILNSDEPGNGVHRLYCLECKSSQFVGKRASRSKAATEYNPYM
jgi:hypothetical protein